jgi:peptidoglycan/LPS O-acetylase OafA/YrhL
MKPATSMYLDGLRFAAAMIVFLGHLGTRKIGDGLFWHLTGYGATAVLVFFVLSGFVIAYVSDLKETNGRDYIVARATRLYSVVIPTLLLTASFDWLGSAINPSFYDASRLLFGSGAWQLPISTIFLGEVWDASIRPGSDEPYWSLGYEVIYYAMFGIGFYCKGLLRVLGCIAIAGLAGPRILSFLPIWLLGAGAYYVVSRRYVGPRLGWAGLVGSICAAVIFTYWARRHGVLDHFAALYEHGVWDTVQDYVLALIFAANLVCFDAIAGASVAPFAQRSIRWLAGATFTLYLLHVPVATFLRATVPLAHESWQYRMLLLWVPLVVVLGVAQVTERRKDLWRPLFENALRWRGGRPRSSPAM